MWTIKIKEQKVRKMKLRYITCSDPREHNKISEMVELAKLPNAEIAAQCHPSKMSAGMPRNIWFNDLLRVARNEVDMNLAIHINMEWANEICTKGRMPDVIFRWINVVKNNGDPVIKRIQLNMPKSTAENINIDRILEILYVYQNREFIFQYNDNNINAIRKLHRAVKKFDKGLYENEKINFSELFDASGGRGLAPKEWRGPVHKEHPMGYSGGISPDNVVENLEKINKVVPQKRAIWIDAEGKLKSPQQLSDGTYKDLFDVDKAKLYVNRANEWQKSR